MVGANVPGGQNLSAASTPAPAHQHTAPAVSSLCRIKASPGILEFLFALVSVKQHDLSILLHLSP